MLQQNLTNPPTIKLPYGTTFPNLTDGPSITKNSCNSYLPSDSTLHRFAAIVNLITANGLYVVGLPCTAVTCAPTAHAAGCSVCMLGGSTLRMPDSLCERLRCNTFQPVLAWCGAYRELGTVSELCQENRICCATPYQRPCKKCRLERLLASWSSMCTEPGPSLRLLMLL